MCSRGFTEDQIGAALANYQREAGETAEGALQRMETEKDADVVLLTDLVILVHLYVGSVPKPVLKCSPHGDM